MDSVSSSTVRESFYSEKTVRTECEFEPRVRSLMELIFSSNVFDEAVRRRQDHTEKSSLDGLATDQKTDDYAAMFRSLNCELKLLNTSSSVFKTLEQYLKNTFVPTSGCPSVDILDIFQCRKEEEQKRFRDIGNKALLWHGSRLKNFVGILKHGLRIAPAGAEANGWYFGKGVYFADMSVSSALFCGATKAKNEALLLLCEVALGRSSEFLMPQLNADDLPEDIDSVVGLGQIVPDPEEAIELDGDIKVPLGKPSEKITSANSVDDFFLQYNEYVVYSENQLRMKYLCRVQFNFK